MGELRNQFNLRNTNWSSITHISRGQLDQTVIPVQQGHFPEAILHMQHISNPIGMSKLQE
jgi:hypothetical protein